VVRLWGGHKFLYYSRIAIYWLFKEAEGYLIKIVSNWNEKITL